MPVIPTQSEVKSSSDSLDTTENLTPHDTVREKKSTALRKRAAHPEPLTYYQKNTYQEKGLDLTQ